MGSKAMQKCTHARLLLLRSLLIFAVALAPWLLHAQSPAAKAPAAPAAATAPAIQPQAGAPNAAPTKAGPRHTHHVLRDVLICAGAVAIAAFVLWRSLGNQPSGTGQTGNEPVH